MTKRPPTVRQLAELAGVSRTTISLALRNHPSISLATRERIQRLANEQGYTVDPLSAQLMNQLRIRRADRLPEKIAFLNVSNQHEEWPECSFNDRHYLRGACERAAKLGYEIEVFWAKEPGMNGRRLSKILHTRSIRGIIIPPIQRPHGHFSLEWQHFSSVTLSHTLFKPDLHRVAHFHFEGMLLALRSLRHHGYRRIGYANRLDEDGRSHHGWLAAYLAFQHLHEPGGHLPPFLPVEWQMDDFAKWLRDHRIEAVVCNLPVILDAPRRLGYRIGEDFGVASLDVQSPAYAGIDQQPHVQGLTAVDIVVSNLQRNEFGLPNHPRITQLSGIWVDGPSVRRRLGARPINSALLGDGAMAGGRDYAVAGFGVGQTPTI